jgi:hypothetical protein
MIFDRSVISDQDAEKVAEYLPGNFLLGKGVAL